MRSIFLLIILSALLLHSDGLMEPEDHNVNVTAILDQLLIGYDKRVRPNYGNIPVTVGVSLYVLSIWEFSEQNMDFTFDMYFRQFWHDPRLAFGQRPGLNKLVINADYIQNIWVPDTFFVNEKEARYHHSTVDNQFLRILHTGDILRSIRMTVKASCPLDLQNYPMDKQLCSLEIESFGFTMSDIRFRWQDGLKSVQCSPDVSLPAFNVVGHRQRLIEASLSSGNYSRLLADIQFERALGHYVIQVYVPMALLVGMSWVVFWLRPEDTSARVGLCAITILALTTIMVSVNTDLPKISYMKAIDIYMGFCFLTVLAALIESAFVAFAMRWIQERRNKVEADQRLSEEMLAEDQERKVTKVEFKQGPVDAIFGFKPIYLDWCSRIGVPVVFLVFNVAYWKTYLGRAQEEGVDDLVYLH